MLAISAEARACCAQSSGRISVSSLECRLGRVHGCGHSSKSLRPVRAAQDIRGVRLTRTLSLVVCPARQASLSFAAQKFLADLATGAAAAPSGGAPLFRTTLRATMPWAERGVPRPSANGARL